MPDQVTFKCLRCGNEFRGIYDTDVERMCPKCRSNSVRRVKEKDKPASQASMPQSNKSS
jgi:predicted  nucleic acid-binding Zn-ribbon protein